MKVYTDGSCNPNPGKGGWAFIGLENEILVYGGENNTTNNKMELTAVIESLKFFQENKLEIYTDSQYVINCCIGKWKRNKNIELWKIYDIISKDRIIKFIWVKGHSGDKYNDLVDKYSKLGSEEIE